MFLYLALLGAVLVLSTIFILRKTPSYSSTTTSTATTTEDGAVPPEPPRVPFWVPFVGNALAFGRDSQGYLQQCQKTYGDAFRLKMMGQDYVFVLDPFSFPNVFREEKKNLSFIAIVREFACKCFGASWDEFEKQNHETVHKCETPPSSLRRFRSLRLFRFSFFPQDSSFFRISLSWRASFFWVLCAHHRFRSFFICTGNSSPIYRALSCRPSPLACANISSARSRRRPSRSCFGPTPAPSGRTATCGGSSWRSSTLRVHAPLTTHFFPTSQIPPAFREACIPSLHATGFVFGWCCVAWLPAVA